MLKLSILGDFICILIQNLLYCNNVRSIKSNSWGEGQGASRRSSYRSSRRSSCRLRYGLSNRSSYLEEFGWVLQTTRAEMQDFCGLSGRANFRENHLKLLLEKGVVKMTIPDKPWVFRPPWHQCPAFWKPLFRQRENHDSGSWKLSIRQWKPHPRHLRIRVYAPMA